jgi:hypothetical protein
MFDPFGNPVSQPHHDWRAVCQDVISEGVFYAINKHHYKTMDRMIQSLQTMARANPNMRTDTRYKQAMEIFLRESLERQAVWDRNHTKTPPDKKQSTYIDTYLQMKRARESLRSPKQIGNDYLP